MILKKKILMIIVLATLLGSVCLGIALRNEKQTNIINDQEIIDNVVPKTFKGTVNDKYNVPIDVMNFVTSYMDDYYLSLYTMEKQDTTKYFKNDRDGLVSDYGIKLTIESRKLYDFDFTMSDAHYDLNITNYEEKDGKYYINFLEDDYMSFKFLNGICSKSYGIENSMIIEKIDNIFKISQYDKTQGYYMMFNDEANKNEDLNSLYDFYWKELTYEINRENDYKIKSQEAPYLASKLFKIPYNRDAAVKYINDYSHNRNSEWDDFEEEGNCQNFASQVLIAGGMKMDYDGDEDDNTIWYYNNNSDYTSSWTGVPYFMKYCMANTGSGLVADVGINIYYAEPGDIIQVGISTVSHSTVVSKIVDGHILLNSNSIDMEDFPLEAYVYPTRKLIKILGSNS